MCRRIFNPGWFHPSQQIFLISKWPLKSKWKLKYYRYVSENQIGFPYLNIQDGSTHTIVAERHLKVLQPPKSDYIVAAWWKHVFRCGLVSCLIDPFVLHGLVNIDNTAINNVYHRLEVFNSNVVKGRQVKGQLSHTAASMFKHHQWDEYIQCNSY